MATSSPRRCPARRGVSWRWGNSPSIPPIQSRSQKLVESRWEETESGRKRRYYRLTEKGTALLDQRRAEWRELFEAMAGLGVVAPLPEGA